MQKTVLQAFKTDEWAVDRSSLTGVSRVSVPSYVLSDPDEPIVLMRFTDGKEDHSSTVFNVETQVVSDTDLNNTLSLSIANICQGVEAVALHADRVKLYMTENKLTHLFCHPDMRLPEGLSAIRHPNFPKAPTEDAYEVFGCTDQAGVIVSNGRMPGGGAIRGFFLRSKEFRRIRMMAPVPSALDFILGDDD
jgi:hypothetical protein